MLLHVGWNQSIVHNFFGKVVMTLTGYPEDRISSAGLFSRLRTLCSFCVRDPQFRTNELGVVHIQMRYSTPKCVSVFCFYSTFYLAGIANASCSAHRPLCLKGRLIIPGGVLH